MGDLAALKPTWLEVDPTGIGAEELAEFAVREVKLFADGIEDRCRSDGVRFSRITVRPVPSPALLEAMAAPGAFRLEVDYEPVIIPGTRGEED